MRRILCIILACLLLAALVLPAVARENVFVPSVSYKESPVIKDAVLDIPDHILETMPKDEPSDEDEPGKEQEEATEAQKQQNVKMCVVVTSINQAKEKTTDIFQEDRDLLLEIYNQILEGTLIVSDEGIAETEPGEPGNQPGQSQSKPEAPGNKPDEPGETDSMKLIFYNEEYVIREMVDVSLRREYCVEDDHIHEDVLNIEDVTITVDFDLGVAKDVKVVVLSYHDGRWSPIERVTNNGDGTITCVFEHFCPVVFCVPASSVEQPAAAEPVPVPEPVEEAEYPLMPLILLILAFLLFLLLIFLRRKRKAEEQAREREEG